MAFLIITMLILSIPSTIAIITKNPVLAIPCAIEFVISYFVCSVTIYGGIEAMAWSRIIIFTIVFTTFLYLYRKFAN